MGYFPSDQNIFVSDCSFIIRNLLHLYLYTQVLQKHIADEKIAQDIKSKLDTTPGIAYSEIAKKASECGRTQLAVRVSTYRWSVYKNK